MLLEFTEATWRNRASSDSTLEGAIDHVGEAHHVIAARLSGDDEAQGAVEPIAGGDAILLLDDEFRLRAALIGGEENGDAALVRVLIHQLRRRLGAGGDQTAAEEGVAACRQIRDDELVADALRQPGRQMLAVIGRD